MKAFCLSVALLVVPAVGAVAQPMAGGSLYPGSGSLYPTPMPPQVRSQTGMRGFHGVPGFHGTHRGRNGNVFIYGEDYVPVVVEEVARDEPPAPPPPAPPPEPRKPYVLGRIYDTLPGGCLKLLQDGAAYYQCSGHWYQEVGEQYKAVRMP